MKLDVQQKILRLDGKSMMVDQTPRLVEGPNGKEVMVVVNGAPEMTGGVALTFERAAREALMSDIEDLDKGKPPGKKIERARLAERMYEEKEPIELGETEATMLLERVSRVWVGALVTYRVDSMITEAKAASLKSKSANGEAKSRHKTKSKEQEEHSESVEASS